MQLPNLQLPTVYDARGLMLTRNICLGGEAIARENDVG